MNIQATVQPDGGSLLVLRADVTLGDHILFSGALVYIRGIFPRMRLLLAVPRNCHDVYRHCEYINELLDPDELTRWRRFHALDRLGLPSFPGKGRLDRFVERCFRFFVPRKRFDFVLCPQKSAGRHLYEILAQIDAARVIGVSGDRCLQSDAEDAEAEALFSERFRVDPSTMYEHEILFYQRFLKSLSPISMPDVRALAPSLSLLPEERQQGESMWQLIERGTRRLRLVAAPCVKKIRQWDDNGWAQVIARAVDRGNVAIVGAKSELCQSAHIVEIIGTLPGQHAERVHDLTGQTSVRQLMAFIAKADCFVGCDSAPLHVACAFGLPTVGIVGGGHLGRFYPAIYKEDDFPVFMKMECCWCNWQCRDSTGRCVKDIPVHEVSTQLDRAMTVANERLTPHRIAK